MTAVPRRPPWLGCQVEHIRVPHAKRPWRVVVLVRGSFGGTFRTSAAARGASQRPYCRARTRAIALR